MHHPDGIRAGRLLASLAAALALVTTGSVSASLAEDPSSSPEQAAEVHGWVGGRAAPAGLYSWREGGRSWMHKIPESGSGSVEITFGTLESPYGIPMGDIGRAGADLDRPYSEDPELAADVHLQAWLLDVDGTRVVVILKSFSDTEPALVAEAQAIVESIYVESTGIGSGRRVVFSLPAGWDSG
jgi:hypothetical protein